MMTTSLNKPSGPSPAQEKILTDAIYPLHFLTLEQIGRFLGYKKTAYNTVGQHLLKLVKSNHLARFTLPTGHGLQPYVYMLGEKGKEYFKIEKEWVIPKLPTVAIMQTRSNSFLMHLLEVNNIIIAAKCIERYNQNAYIIQFAHDLALKKNPVECISLIGKKVSIAPDAIIEIEASGRRVLWIELERGTNNDKYILEKMNDIYDVFDRRAFQERVNTNRCRVCYMTTAGYTDVERLRKLARKVLTDRLGDNAPESKRNMIFNFIAIPAMGVGEIDVTNTFLQSTWLRAFHLAYSPILE